MVLYNLTNLTSASNVADIAIYANSSTNGVLFGFGLVGFFIIMLLALKRYNFDSAVLASSFVMFIVSGIFSYGGYITIMFPLGFLLILIMSAFYNYMINR